MGDLFHLFKVYFRLGVLNEMQYRVNFWVQLMQSTIALITGLAVLGLVYSYTETLQGWTAVELLAVMGVHTLMGGVVRTFVEPNMGRIINSVQQGTLDYTLTKPADSQVLVSLQEFRIWQLVDVVLGLVILGYALLDIQGQVGWLQTLLFLLALLMGGLMIYSVWLTVTTGAFWFVQMGDIIQVFQSMYQAGRWPVGIYPDWLRSSLTFIVPVAFAVTVPAETLVGRLNWGTLGLQLALTIAMMSVARGVWRWGLSNYTGASA